MLECTIIPMKLEDRGDQDTEAFDIPSHAQIKLISCKTSGVKSREIVLYETRIRRKNKPGILVKILK